MHAAAHRQLLEMPGCEASAKYLHDAADERSREEGRNLTEQYAVHAVHSKANVHWQAIWLPKPLWKAASR